MFYDHIPEKAKEEGESNIPGIVAFLMLVFVFVCWLAGWFGG